MKHPILLRQVLRKIHTPAICDSGCRISETRTHRGIARSTPLNEAVHICGPLSSPPNVGAASGAGSQR